MLVRAERLFLGQALVVGAVDGGGAAGGGLGRRRGDREEDENDERGDGQRDARSADQAERAQRQPTGARAIPIESEWGPG